MPRGEVVNLKVFQRLVDDGEVMIKWDAVGLSEGILLSLKKAGVNLIRIVNFSYNRETRIYYTTVGAFLASNLKHEYIPGDLNLFVRFSDMIKQNYIRQTRLL